MPFSIVSLARTSIGVIIVKPTDQADCKKELNNGDHLISGSLNTKQSINSDRSDDERRVKLIKSFSETISSPSSSSSLVQKLRQGSICLSLKSILSSFPIPFETSFRLHVHSNSVQE